MSEKKFCRLCLSQPAVGFSVLENGIPDMIESLTSIKITSDDVFPTLSCTKCILNIKFAFDIQQTILKSHEKLQEMLFSNVNIKQEKIVDDIILKTETLEENPSIESKLNIRELNENTASYFDDNIITYNSTCIICGLKIANKSITSHMEDHFRAEQECDICGISCDNIKAYRQHFIDNHEILSYKCNKCERTFQYKSFYDIHMKMAHKDLKTYESSLHSDDYNLSSTEMKNKIVKLGIRSKKAITVLMNSGSFKTDGDQYKCNPASLKKKCPICESYITSGNLKKHISNHTSGQQICEICGATLRSYESLRGHMFYSHKQKSYTCDECGKKFTKKYPFELHKRKEHTGEKTHICDTCGKSFFTLYYLNKHIKMTHLKLRPYVCRFCERGFSSRFALKTHERQHTNEAPYKCEICGDGFRQNVSLRAHRKSKHDIVEPKTCVCKICGKGFGCEQAIKSHMRLH